MLSIGPVATARGSDFVTKWVWGIELVATEAVLELEFFTPKALHNLAQGITLG
jgi:hypothetical protein